MSQNNLEQFGDLFDFEAFDADRSPQPPQPQSSYALPSDVSTGQAPYYNHAGVDGKNHSCHMLAQGHGRQSFQFHGTEERLRSDEELFPSHLDPSLLETPLTTAQSTRHHPLMPDTGAQGRVRQAHLSEHLEDTEELMQQAEDFLAAVAPPSHASLPEYHSDAGDSTQNLTLPGDDTIAVAGAATQTNAPSVPSRSTRMPVNSRFQTTSSDDYEDRTKSPTREVTPLSPISDAPVKSFSRAAIVESTQHGGIASETAAPAGLASTNPHATAPNGTSSSAAAAAIRPAVTIMEQHFTDPSFRETFSSAGEALAYTIRRIPLQVDDDDVEEVERQGPSYRKRIMRAIVQSEYLIPAQRRKKNEMVDLTEEEVAAWKRWQGEPAKVLKHMWNNFDPTAMIKVVEANAWTILDEIIKVHKVGYLLCSRPDTVSICSARVEAAISCIESYTLVRADFLEKGMDHEQFAAAPKEYGEAKARNFWSNLNRKQKSGQEATKPRALGFGSAIYSRYYTKNELKHMKKGVEQSIGEGGDDASDDASDEDLDSALEMNDAFDGDELEQGASRGKKRSRATSENSEDVEESPRKRGKAKVVKTSRKKTQASNRSTAPPSSTTMASSRNLRIRAPVNYAHGRAGNVDSASPTGATDDETEADSFDAGDEWAEDVDDRYD